MNRIENDITGALGAAGASPGSMADLVRGKDWSKTPVGAIVAWPESLKTLVGVMLGSNYPMWMAWGREALSMFYNDGYVPMLGKKHPDALGQSASIVWSEVWHVIGPMIEPVFSQGKSIFCEELQLMMERRGFREECYFTFSYSPVPDDAGNIEGMFCACFEDTGRVLSRRRLSTLKDLSEAVAKAKTAAEAVTVAMTSLTLNPNDLPFVLVYTFEGDNGRLKLRGSTGLPQDQVLGPASVDPSDVSGAWPFLEVSKTRKLACMDDVKERVGEVQAGPWPEFIRTAVTLPISQSGTDALAGFLVVGISPCLALDVDYKAFLELIARQVANGLGNARAYDEERQRAERLAELDRAKTAFFSNVSHEFRTPLALIIGPLEDLLASAKDRLSVENQERLTVAHRNCLRLLKLVNTLLDFSRLEAGRDQAIFEPVDVAGLTSNLAGLFRSAMAKAGLDFVVKCPPLPEAAYIDRERWEKIVLNLLSNALKFTQKGRITVETRLVGDAIQLSVQDTGCGIPEKEVGNIFKRFHRVEGVRGRTIEGSGIGLALVNELVKLHGGDIHVESTYGAGSKFVVSVPRGKSHLPPASVREESTTSTDVRRYDAFSAEAMRWLSADERHEPAETTSAAQGAAPRARILLADDNADMRDYVRSILEHRFDVDAVGDGQSALQAARAAPPDLVLTDVMMPALDGIGLLCALRNDESLKTVPVILLSARAGEEAKVEGLEVGADDYLVKPFSARELLARVDGVVKMARLRDEAARLQIEIEAEKRSNKLKDEFLATVSHELRTPLNAIRGYSELLTSEDPDSQEFVYSLNAIQRNVDAQTQIIDDLLDISRILNGKLRFASKSVRVDEVVAAAIEVVQLSAKAKKVEIESQVSVADAEVLGDAARLRQVFWNLLTNAIKFSQPGGTVTVSLEKVAERTVELSVRDQGEGIRPEFLPFVFLPFRQADQSRTRRHGGLGLGLAIAHQIVEAHGGRIRAESAGVGKGTVITVALPLLVDTDRVAKAAGGRQQRGLSSDRPLHGLKVLAVDDQADAVGIVRLFLKRAGADVRTATDAAEAFEIVRNWHPDVLISDIGMPNENGLDLIRRIRTLPSEEGGATPAAALTAWVAEEERKEALGAGFQAHIAKPVESERLILTTAQLAGRMTSAGRDSEVMDFEE